MVSPKDETEQLRAGYTGLSGRPPSLGEHRGRTPSVLPLVPGQPSNLPPARLKSPPLPGSLGPDPKSAEPPRAPLLCLSHGHTSLGRNVPNHLTPRPVPTAAEQRRGIA